MSCEARRDPAPARRSIAGWLTLAAISVVIGVYVHVFGLVLAPHVDEAYRRTFVTGEFGVFPEANAFAPGGGLDYQMGSLVDLRQPDQRRWLSRFEWEHNEQPIVTLRGLTGHLYLHITGEPDAGQRAHKLAIALRCRIAHDEAGDVDVRVNGESVGSVDCGSGMASLEADLPVGRIGVKTYDVIEIRRSAGSLYERILTRLGLRARAVELVAFSIAPP